MIKGILPLLFIFALVPASFSQHAGDYYKSAKRQIDSLDKLKKGADYTNAFNLLHKATELDPKLKEAWYESGRLMHKTGANGMALEYLEKALSLDPKYADAIAVRGVVYCSGTETKKQGCADLKKAKKLGCRKAQDWIEIYCTN
jgi:tetratricopeptide (TPR) repeat protein